MQNKFIDAVIIFLILAVGFSFFRVIRGNAELRKRVELSEYKASNVIDEVGRARQETVLMFEKIADSEKRLSDIARAIGKGSAIDAIEMPQPRPRVQVTRRLAPETFNILIAGHNKGLADSIMVAAIDENRSRITLISIPRDLSVNGRKINEYLMLYGAKELGRAVSAAAGLAIHRYIAVDFIAFENFINAIGGVDIYVAKDINDAKYPASGGGYENYSIAAGSHHFDGAQALKFSRSRHSTSDFDRAFRQQELFRAMRNSVIAMDFPNKLETLNSIWNFLINNVETDIGLAEAAGMIGKYQLFQIKPDIVFSTANYLYSAKNPGGQYILLPNKKDFSEIKNVVASLLSGD